jgi:hypothetical protein
MLKKLLKKINVFRWYRFKREAVILFANLKRNDKANKHLSELLRVVFLASYILGMLAFAVIYNIIVGV